ncbi:site-specific integrase [Muricauda oceani]|uniref:Site-specific integrase n=1 Tax=Flagellimonas oceani TaxID=2698672 RepID=A0A6G7J062_9FLAO|nr:site-specific integrase [Allomuricauda oceani]MBW8244858.1 site-specific integrase [Allomuricauda oceani]QII43832.1 site-specific integrase [Allomuricauda oceani]
MKTSNSFSISFWLKKTAKKKDGQIPIYVRIRFKGRYSDISVHRSTLEECWCPISGKIDHRVKGASSINKYLDDIHANLLECHRQLYSEGTLITSRAIKLRYLGKDKVFVTLEDLIRYHRTHEISRLEKGTVKNYSATEKYLKSFIKKKFRTPDIGLSFIDYTFVMEFENFLRKCDPINKSQPLNNNGIMKHMERFKKLVNIAHKFGCISQNPFNFYKMKFEEYDSDFLEEHELKKIAGIEIPEAGIGLVRDVFLFACYTGLSYIEVKMLGQKDIVRGIDGEQWINVRRKKTKTPVRVPLLIQAKEILGKYSSYRDKDNGKCLLPVYSNQRSNKHLKTIAKRAHINKHLTFHVARHTFATTITLMNNVPLETVSKLLGHTKLSTTQRYARVVEKKISKDMGRLKELMKLKSDNESTHDHSNVQLRVVR